MSHFSILATPLLGLHVVQRKRLQDLRGFFSRLFCAGELAQAGFKRPVAQINQTLTQQRGAVRGMHFQYPPHAEDKLVTCLRGEIYDVAVDLRRGSPTFLHWHAELLTEYNQRSLMIPQGFAHGFQALASNSELLYLHSRPYAPTSEGALHVSDPALAIAWPLPIVELSSRDASHPYITRAFNGI